VRRRTPDEAPREGSDRVWGSAATAVEIVGFFRQELLKSGEGSHAWKQLLKLMASEIALCEKSASVPGMPLNRKDIRDELRRWAAHVDALARLHAFGQGLVDLQEIDTQSAHWFLLELDTLNRRLKITGYRLDARARATLDYETVERSLLGSVQLDAVLASVQSMAELKKAYTNYFLDTRKFTSLVGESVSTGPAVSGEDRPSAIQTKMSFMG
jgi:putative GTP pyrophosphokinase